MPDVRPEKANARSFRSYVQGDIFLGRRNPQLGRRAEPCAFGPSRNYMVVKRSCDYFSLDLHPTYRLIPSLTSYPKHLRSTLNVTYIPYIYAEESPLPLCKPT